jgi:hypothetical protein
MNTTGLCSRYTVIRRADSEPIDGALYRDYRKTRERAKRCHDPESFAVREVVVMPADLARQLVEFYVANTKGKTFA